MFDSSDIPDRQVVIIGGGLAGMLAAAALSKYTDRIIIVERDRVPQASAPRRGLPQGRHVHLLWSGGSKAIEELLPGTTGRLLTAGAHRLSIPTNMVGFSSQGWFRRWSEESHHVLLSSRDLLDATIRSEVLAHPHVTLLEETEMLGLAGTPWYVTGARLRTADGQTRTVPANLVIDASGRGSRAPSWLTALGLPATPEKTVDSGLVYASRTFQAPPGAETYPVVNVQADPRGSGPGQSATLTPIEDSKWLVTIAGTRGGEPTSDPAAFIPFALGLRDPIVGKLLTHAEPLTDVSLTRTTSNRRRFFENAQEWPQGFVVLGDAAAAYNPVYGHGMTVAAQGALALREIITTAGLTLSGSAQKAQQAIARPINTAWNLATSQDIHYLGASDTPPTTSERLTARFLDRLIRTSTGSGRVARAVTDVMTMERSPARLASPSVLLAVALGPPRKQLTAAPLSAEELAAALDHEQHTEASVEPASA
ncbi:FAD-dependent monooxygenase [Streptomyces sp. E11-3]|uniref:NAD(P)/FAD-dependent oxidoreductase n=1 Tax=Streptomyces sp. E11-3 TaxID=3110112 RepID=UPI00397EA2DC